MTILGNFMLAGFIITTMATLATMDWFSRRNPMGISARLFRKMAGPNHEDWREVTTVEALAELPNGTVIVDANQLTLERHEGRWLNTRGKRQNRIGLPARVVD